MSKFLREPLFHFLLLGGLIFIYYHFIQDNKESKDIILIDQAEYDYLLDNWKKRWNKEPDPKDIKAFIEQYIREEVFYQEALKLNLDHNDVIVKRRLSQKMEAVSNDLSALIKPANDQELRNFYNENKELFRQPPSYSFKQVLFLKNEPEIGAEIKALHETLQLGAPLPSSRRNKLSLANEWKLSSVNDLNNAFGGEFAFQLDSLPLNAWSGPIESGYGFHLVYLSERRAGQLASFDEARPYINQEFEYRTELEMQEKMFRDLLKNYDVRITAEGIPSNVDIDFPN